MMQERFLINETPQDDGPLEDVEREEELEPRLVVMKKTFKRAFIMALSFTYSAELPILLNMLGHIQNNDSNNTESLAAATLTITVLDTAILTSVSSTFAMIFEGGNIYGQITNLVTPEEEKVILKKDISRMIKNSLILASPFALSSMGMLFFSKYILLNWFEQDEKISALAQQFLRPMASLIPLYTLRFCYQPIFFIHQKQISVNIISLTGFFFFGVFLANGLGFGHFSLPNMGVRGIFFGVMSENIFTTLGLAAALFDPSFGDYHFFTSFFHCEAEDWNQFKILAKQGIPLVLTYLSELSTLFCKSIMAGRLGNDQLAAQNFSGQVSFFVLFLAHAFSQATALGIGGAHNSNKPRFAQYGLLSSFIASTLPCIVVSVYPEILTMLFSVDSLTQEVMSLSHLLIPLAAGTSVLYTVAFTMLQSLRMTQNHIKPTIIFNAWLWVSVLSGYILGFTTKLGVVGIGIGSLLGNGLGAAHLFSFWKREYINPIEKNETTEPMSGSGRSISLTPSSSNDSFSGHSSSTFFSSAMNCFRNWYQGTTSNRGYHLNGF